MSQENKLINKRCNQFDNQQRKKNKSDFIHLIEDVKYEFKNNLRYVEPYIYHHQTYAKQRWLGKQILDVYCSEFAAYSKEYYEECIKSGRITVNDHSVTCDYIIKNGDLICHSVHRHEPPVKDEKVYIISETEDIYCVYKPSSIPVHPCGAYRHNTLEFILKTELKLSSFYFIHRLDRVTSGLMLLAKSSSIASSFSKILQSCQAHKVYLCICEGEINMNNCIQKDNVMFIDSVGIKVDIPISVVSYKEGIYECNMNGKKSCTYFYPLYTYKVNNDSNETDKNLLNECMYHTLMLCIPVTGRTHQIRLHTQYLNHAIYNDIHYNPRIQLTEKHTTTSWTPSKCLPDNIKELPLEKRIELTCKYCQLDEKERYEALYNNEQLYFSSIALHAYIYIMNSVIYECSLPQWNEIGFIDSKELTLKIHDRMNKIFNYDKENPFIIENIE